MVRLGDLVTLNYGKALPTSSRTGAGYPVVGSGGIVGHHRDRLVQGPSIVVGRKGSIGSVEYLPDGGWPIDTTYFVDTDSTSLDLRWLFHLLRHLPLASMNKSAAVPGLNRDDVYALKLSVPAWQEQRRVADILDLSAGLERLHLASTDLLAELESTLVLDHTKSDLSQPIRLSDLGRISTGKTPPTSEDSNFGGRIPFVTPGDLGIDHAPSRHLSESGASQARLVRSGSTLVCCIGATIGKVGVASEPSAFNQQINAIEWDEELVDDIYGMLAMRSLAKLIAARGTSTTLPIINKTDFSALTLQLPALSVQRQVAAKWKCIKSLRAQHDRAVAVVRLQQASLADRAFKGEL